MPECRMKLLADASESVSSSTTVIGEHCHIVGEKDTGPRGHSNLSDTDRDRYPNLILLCPAHHKVIDDDMATWTVERLHQLKADHEVWVESLVPDAVGDEVAAMYATLVNMATARLDLEHWPDITAAALLDLVGDDFVSGVLQFRIAVTAAHLTGRHPQLDSELLNLAKRAGDFVDLFLTRATLDRGSWRRDDSWKSVWRADYHEELQRFFVWEAGCSRLLFNLTVAVNRFAQAVRDTVRPTYFLSAGKFYVVDSMGSLDELQPKVYFPNEYKDIADTTGPTT